LLLSDPLHGTEPLGGELGEADERQGGSPGDTFLKEIRRGLRKCPAEHCSIYIGSALLAGNSSPDTAKSGRDCSDHMRTRLNGCLLKPITGGGLLVRQAAGQHF